MHITNRGNSLWAISAGFTLVLILLASVLKPSNSSAQVQHNQTLNAEDFLSIVDGKHTSQARQTLDQLDARWRTKYAPMVIEAMRYTRSSHMRSELQDLLEKHSRYNHAENTNDWYQWLWNLTPPVPEDYADFKAQLYGQIDPRFETYFKDRQDSARIRLDEIRWGGVAQDGIPPLRNPEMLTADEADYLSDDNIVFGVKINGEARAYPKRILAWHEMFTDTFGQGEAAEPIAGVYCTLCGTVIIYKTRHNGVDHHLGTSGFLYRSNKLMYDQATQSLWSTVRGEPVLGPLVNQGIALEHLSVVTTTWAEWKRRHPETTVLSLSTGHKRDYGEGVAYSNYFSSDRLMFNTPFSDRRLNNKQEVLALRFQAAPDKQLAIDTDFLNKNRIFYEQIGQQRFVVLTDDSGANRVYQAGSNKFISYDGRNELTDENNLIWRLSEEKLSNNQGQTLERLPYHRAFWFGWLAAYPETRLIK